MCKDIVHQGLRKPRNTCTEKSAEMSLIHIPHLYSIHKKKGSGQKVDPLLSNKKWKKPATRIRRRIDLCPLCSIY